MLNFNKADYISINNYLNNIYWNEDLREVDVDGAVDFLYLHLQTVTSLYVLVFSIRKLFYPVWFSSELKYLTKAKRVVHRNYKNSNLYADYLIFHRLRAQCKSLSSVCLNEYASRSENAINNNVNSFWNFIKSMRSRNSAPDYMYCNGKFVEDGQTIANYFAEYFESALDT